MVSWHIRTHRLFTYRNHKYKVNRIFMWSLFILFRNFFLFLIVNLLTIFDSFLVKVINLLVSLLKLFILFFSVEPVLIFSVTSDSTIVGLDCMFLFKLCKLQSFLILFFNRFQFFIVIGKTNMLFLSHDSNMLHLWILCRIYHFYFL